MKEEYILKVNETYEFTQSPEEINRLDVLQKGAETYHLIDKQQTYKVQFAQKDFQNKKYEVFVNGNKYHVSIKDNVDALIEKMGLTLGNKTKEANIFAPMPGLILDILVQENQEIKEGDALLILEAMKMENILTATKDTLVKSIKVQKGDAVDKKDLLIEME